MRTDTSYLGMRLPHPFIAGASPFGHRLDTVKRLEDAGCAAVVLHSLFEEQITEAMEGRIRHIDPTDHALDDVRANFPRRDDYPLGPDAYAEHVRRVKGAVAIPVIASLNGGLTESWLRFAQVLERAGADALELNLYQIASDLHDPAAAVESRLCSAVRELKRILRIPVAVKLSPFYTAFANVALSLDRAGADGLVLFNRFYQPDIDIRTMKVLPSVELSHNNELPLRLRWTAILFGRIRPSITISGGIENPDDGIKAILAGADAVQVVSVLLRHGPAYVAMMRTALERWMEWHEAEGIEDVRGRSSLEQTIDPAAFERAHYIRDLQAWGK